MSEQTIREIARQAAQQAAVSAWGIDPPYWTEQHDSVADAVAVAVLQAARARFSDLDFGEEIPEINRVLEQEFGLAEFQSVGGASVSSERQEPAGEWEVVRAGLTMCAVHMLATDKCPDCGWVQKQAATCRHQTALPQADGTYHCFPCGSTLRKADPLRPVSGGIERGEEQPPTRSMEWGLGNCYMLARRELRRLERMGCKADSMSVERWQHVVRICEEAGAKSKGVLRATLPTEYTEESPASGAESETPDEREQ